MNGMHEHFVAYHVSCIWQCNSFVELSRRHGLCGITKRRVIMCYNIVIIVFGTVAKRRSICVTVASHHIILSCCSSTRCSSNAAGVESNWYIISALCAEELSVAWACRWPSWCTYWQWHIYVRNVLARLSISARLALRPSNRDLPVVLLLRFRRSCSQKRRQLRWFQWRRRGQ
jgi:hypothetical protein